MNSPKLIRKRQQTLFFLIYIYIYFLIYFWLHWVFVAVRRLSLVAASGGYSSLQCVGFSLWWLLLLQSTGSRRVGFSSCGTRALLLCGMWDLPGPGLEPVPRTLAGGFLTTAPPGKPNKHFFKWAKDLYRHFTKRIFKWLIIIWKEAQNHWSLGKCKIKPQWNSTALPPEMLKFKRLTRASLVAQWSRIHLPMQGTRVPALLREDPTCCRATKPMHHNYWTCALEPASHNYWACMPQLLKPACLEPVLRNKRSHRNEKPAHHNEEQPPLAATRESPRSHEYPTQPK